MHLKRFLRRLPRRIKHTVFPLRYPERFLHQDVPYFSQWGSRERNAEIIARTFDVKDDPNWKNSGAKTKQEHEDWSWSGCGMACTKMLLAHQTGKVYPLVELGKKCAEYGGYKFPLKDHPGLFYRPYITFMREEFGLKARIVADLMPRELLYELGRGNYMLASVTAEIREGKGKPKEKSGHLILLLGYDAKKREVYFHNPSGDRKETQENVAISLDRFYDFFSGRGIVVETKIFL